MSQIAGLTPDQETQILALLRQCVVRIQAGDCQGTGFFVAPRQVLTCRDVIDSAIRPGGAPVSVTWYQNSDDAPRELSATLRDDAPLDWPDVAILNVPEANDCPCVLLDASPVAPGTPLLTAGYTYRSLITYQLQKFIAGYPGHDKDNRPVLRIAGNILGPGESGSPIVSLQSGLVVGIVRVVRDNYSALGGSGTIFADIIGEVPYLQSLEDRPPPSARDWISILTPIQLKQSGRESSTGRRWRQTSTPPRIGPTPETNAAAGLRVFVSYSHKDERYCEKLDVALAQLRRNGLISTWYDRKILPGDEWDREINENLNSADLVLLLISPDFLASDYAYNSEMSQVLERQQSRSAALVPIILRPSDWRNSPLGSLQALPSKGRPVSSWSNRDEAWLDIVQGLRRLISAKNDASDV